MEIGDSLFMACGNESEIEKILSISRDRIAKELGFEYENELAHSASYDSEITAKVFKD